MPRKKKSEHFWNTLDLQIVESAANTLTSVDIPTGVSPAMARVMLVKRIIVSIGAFDVSAARTVGSADALIMCLSTVQGATTIPGLQDNGTIWYHAPLSTAGGDGATAAESPAGFQYMGGFPPYIEFDDPIPVADDEITLYIEGIGLGGAVTAGFKMYYRVDEVSLEEALTILESYR